jgi:hypothetical protein
MLRKARARLLGTSSCRGFGRAAAQQGLLQITRDFCDHSDSLCDPCKVPDLLRHFWSK